MKQKIQTAVLAFLAAVAFSVGVSGDAQALSGVISNTTQNTWSASGTRVEIKGPTGSGQVMSFDCVNLSATPVYVGGVTVTSSLGVPYCTSSAACPKGAGWGYDARGTYMTWTGTLNNCDPAAGADCVRCAIGVSP